jgi:hypothetical protein
MNAIVMFTIALKNHIVKNVKIYEIKFKTKMQFISNSYFCSRDFININIIFMKHEYTPTGTVKEKLAIIQGLENQLINEKKGSEGYCFALMMSETDRVNFMTKPIKRPHNFNSNQNKF